MSFKNKKLKLITSIKGNSRKGFTLVELIVILAVLSILLGITVFSALAWMDWSRFKHENTVAEELFFAAQNQLTEFDSSGAMKRRVNDVLMEADGSNYKSEYILAQGKSETVEGLSIKEKFQNITLDEDSGYVWNEIWLNDNNLTRERRTIISLNAQPGDYQEYLAGTLTDSGTKLLFELVDSYVTDKSVLNGAITLEFSPEAVQVFAVCYSSLGHSLAYGGEGGAINISKRGIADREESLLGYYGVETLTAKLRGHSDVQINHKLEIENGNMLSLILSKTNPTYEDFHAGDRLIYTILGARSATEEYTPVMSFEIDFGTSAGQLNPANRVNILNADSSVVEVDMTITNGMYNDGAPHTFRVPAWIDSDGSVYVVLDAVDAQAQSLTYASAKGLISGLSTTDIDQAKSDFRNTFSFYRFGLENINYIRANVVIKSTGKVDEPIDAVRKGVTTPYGENDIDGERTTFANFSPDYTTIASNTDYNLSSANDIFGISNARHFYNIRFESDYKRGTDNRLFLQRETIDWNDLIAGSYKEGNENITGVNFFLNSYFAPNPADANKKAGINFSGDTVEFKRIDESNNYVSVGTNTRFYPFPSFRMLGFGDLFTQENVLDVDHPEQTHYTIENISMSFSANCVYGVYGKTYHDDFIDNFNNDDCNYITTNSNAKGGSMPLGLFAESYGVIKNLELVNVSVKGVEGVALNETSLKPTLFLFTSKVGSFVGENFGTVSNLFVDANKNIEATSKVSGRSDVGGIVGHQYRKARLSTVQPAATTVLTFENCINNADVTGICYVGGIIGRIYPGTPEPGSTAYNTGIDKYDISIGGKKFSNNTLVASAELTGVKIDGTDIVIIEKCKNYGEIGMEYYFANYAIDNNTFRRGFFFGGITGAALTCYHVNDPNKYTYGYKHYYTLDNGTKPNRKTVVSNCESYTLYTEEEIINLVGSDDYVGRIARGSYVGGIVGGARFASIENCSTTPGSDMLSFNNVKYYPFVLGDRYVGGVAGYSVETDYTWPEDRSEYTRKELEKIETLYSATGFKNDISAIRPNNSYSVINGANVIGNFAIGGVTGCYGRPDSGISGNELYGENLELRFNTDFSYPYGSGQMNDSTYEMVGALNVAAVFGNNFSMFKGESGNVERGCYFGVGGVAGLVTVNINNCDNIQPEDTKLRTLKLIGFDTTNKTKVSEVLDDISVADIQTIINDSDLVTDGVGGICGQIYGHGNFNNNTAYNSHVDAIVFGRNRVGGFIGDNSVVVDRYGASVIQNLYPYKLNSNSTGTYIIGKDIVGGVVGAYTDGRQGRGRYKADGFGSVYGSLNGSSKYGYDNGSIHYGYHVLGVRAVGGVIGDFLDHHKGLGNSMYDLNFKTDFTGDYEDERIVVKGSMYVGGITGIQEKSASSGNSTYPYRYYVTASNIDVTADACAGGVVGAIYTREAYFDMSKLVTGTVTNSTVSSKLFAGGMVGLYAINDSSNRLTHNSVEWKPETGNYNYKPDDSWESVNGLYKNVNIKALSYDNGENSTLSANLENIRTKIAGKLNTAATFDMSGESTVLGNDVSVTSKVYSGGLLGYVPELSPLTFQKYINQAKVFTTESIAGIDGYNYSYLGGIMGRVPVGVTVEDCGNLSGTPETYYSTAGMYMGGLTEVNAGTVKGTTNAGEFSCVNRTPYNYGNDKNIAAFVGVNNGTVSSLVNDAAVTGKWSAGIVVENDSTITDCINKGSISGQYAGGIAAYSGTASSITGSENHGFVTASAPSESEGCGSAGILYQAKNAAVTIADCVNTGVVSSGTPNVNSAGIAYDTDGKGVINLCRNYGTGLVYGITAKDAYKIHYCLDSSNSDVHIGRVDSTGSNADTAESRNYANFWIGERNDTMIPYTPLVIRESEEFRAYQFYSVYPDSNITAKKNSLNPTADYINTNYVSTNNSIISTSVLGKTPVEGEYSQDDNARWPLTYTGVDNSYLTFRVQPVIKTKDGINEAYTSCNKFAVCWDNKQQNSNSPIDGHYELRTTTETSRYAAYIAENGLSKTVVDPNTPSFAAVAANAFNGSYAESYGHESNYFTQKAHGKNAFYYFAYDVFYNLMVASGGQPITVDDFVAALYEHADTDLDSYKNKTGSVNDDSYREEYKSEQTTTQTFSYQSVGWDEYVNGSNYDTYKKEGENAFNSYFTQTDAAAMTEELDKFLFNAYCYMLDNNDVTGKTDDDMVALYLQTLYNWVDWTPPVTSISMNVSLVLRDVNGYEMQTDITNISFSTRSAIQTFDLNELLSTNHAVQQKDPLDDSVVLFDISRIKTIDVVVTSITGTNTDGKIGIRTFMWDNGESTGNTYVSMPSVDEANDVIDDPYVAALTDSNSFSLYDAFKLMSGLDESGNGPIARTKLTLEQQTAYPYRVMLSDTNLYTEIQANNSDPRSESYLLDNNTFEDSNRKTVWIDLDKEYVDFIKKYRPSGAEAVISGH